MCNHKRLLLALLFAVLVTEISAGWFRSLARFGEKIGRKYRGKRTTADDDAAAAAAGDVDAVGPKSLKTLPPRIHYASRMGKLCQRFNAASNLPLTLTDLPYFFRQMDANKDGSVNLREMQNFVGGYEECMRRTKGKGSSRLYQG